MSGRPDEPRETRLKRLRIQCWRRGTKEMDLLLGPFVDAEGAGLDDADLAAFEALAGLDDDMIYPWLIGTAEPPEPYRAMVRRIAAARASRPR